jgi:hypothetical protein
MAGPPIENEGLPFSKVVDQFAALGVTELFVKWLAPNDNSKNQVYLARGAGSDELLNIFPTSNIRKERTPDGNDTIKAAVSFGWLDERGELLAAPNAQLILYPQYPEVRLSGFLLGAERHPGGLMTTRSTGRVLLLGVTRGHVLAAAVFSADSATVRELRRREIAADSILIRIQLQPDKRKELLVALLAVHRKGWIASRRLSSNGVFFPCIAPNCSGMTLEAELGIPANSSKEPDYLGWELKAHSAAQSALTLMTPEPTGGLYRELTPREFLTRFGRSNAKTSRLDFTGPFQAGEFARNKELHLDLEGFDRKKQAFDPSGGLVLVSRGGDIAAEWSFESLLGHWSVKHARVAYVPCQRRITPSNQYSYAAKIGLGTGTRFALLLSALATGAVKYDPGIHLDAGQKTPKRRSQFRIARTQLATLYDGFEVVDLTS